MDFTQELQEACTAARLAGEYVQREYQVFTPIPNAPASISTHVDHEAQEIILRHLRSVFPGDSLVAEEQTPTLTASPVSERTWVVDPIDGTRGFAMKNGEFSVMIGLTIQNRPVVGVVLEPVAARMTYGAKGHGCWVVSDDGKPRRCQVSAQSNLSVSILVQSHTRPGKPSKPVVTALRAGSIIETYSAGLKLAIVARGEAELYVNDYAGFHDWDICAGHVLVEEAGGRVSLFDGTPIVYGGSGSRQRKGMIASNGRVHDAAVNRLVSLE